jgi:hypothetical protein
MKLDFCRALQGSRAFPGQMSPLSLWRGCKTLCVVLLCCPHGCFKLDVLRVLPTMEEIPTKLCSCLMRQILICRRETSGEACPQEGDQVCVL